MIRAIKDKKDIVLDEYVPLDQLVVEPSASDILIDILEATDSLPLDTEANNEPM